MNGLFSLAGVLGGTVLACAADQMPSHRETFERAGGILLLAGLGVLGGALRHFC